MTEEERNMSTPTREDQRFNIMDGQRQLTFTGWEIADADSQSGFDVRWTELRLYRTTTGKYILEKIGRSDVFHSGTCTRTSKGVRFATLDEAVPADASDSDTLDDLFVPCEHCKPPFDVSPAWVERDISSVSMYETAAQTIESLYRPEHGKARFLSRVARALLEKAAQEDSDIRAILEIPADVT